MSRSLHGVIIAVALALPSAAAAQVQVNQNFMPQGPSPSFGPTIVTQSGDAPPNGNVAGAVGPVVADPVNANTLYIGTPGGGIWKTTNGGTTWAPLTDNQASLSVASLSLDPTDPGHQTLIAGTGLTANGTVCNGCLAGSGGLRNGLLYSKDGGSTWASLGATTLSDQSVVGVAARGNVLVAGTYEISGFATDRNTGALYRSTDSGATFTKISGTAGTGLPNGPISSIMGDPNNPNRLYSAVTAPNAGTNASTALYLSNDTGATWTKVFDKNDSAGTIQASTQTILKIATGPGGAVAVAVVDYLAGTNGKVTGLFWSGNAGTSWTSLPTPTLSDGVKQGSVNSAIVIDPNNKNLVYVAGDGIVSAPFTLPAFRIDASALTMTSITDTHTADGSTIHSDSRSMTFDALGRLIVTSDGTIYARTNPQSDSGAWTRLSGNVSAFQTYVVGYDAVGKRLITAAQDSGVTIQSSRNAPQWNAVMGADGVNALVNDVTLAAAGQTAFYASYFNLLGPVRIILDKQGNQISPNTPSGGEFFGVGTAVTCNGTSCDSYVAGAAFNRGFSSPWVNNRIDPTRMVFAGTHVYVTQDTLTGAQDPNATTVDLTLTDIGTTGAFALKAAYGTRDNPNMLVVAADASHFLWQSTTATAGSLVSVNAYRAGGGDVPTGLVLDPRSQQRYYVADFTNLWGTTNQGASFVNLTSNLPASFIRPTAVEFISNNGVNALLVGGLNSVADAQSTIAIADSDGAGALSNWRPFGNGLPNPQVSTMFYHPTVDVLAVGTFGRGVFTLYDVTSYFPQATVLQFGLADNDSTPDASFLTNGTSANRPLIKYGSGTLTITGNATYTGGTTINSGMLVLGNGGTDGSILGNVTFCGNAADPLCEASNSKALAFNRSDMYTFGGAITGPGQVFQLGSGTTVLTNVNTYTGPTAVNAGSLLVNGSIASSSLTTVNAGATLGGNGTVGNTTINGGTLSPGNSIGTLNISGSLVMSAAAAYIVEVSPATADRTNVTGTASLAGSVQAIFQPGTYLGRSYTILSASGGRTGTFASFTSNVGSGFSASLSYTPTDVLLNLTAALGSASSLNPNQQAVAGAINTFFNNGGALPPGFATVFNLTGQSLANALTQLSGEGATGMQQSSFLSSGLFLNAMLDPFVEGRNSGFGASPMSYAPERSISHDAASAFAAFTKAPPKVATIEERWGVWGATYGGYNRTDGDPAGLGSHDLTARTGGFAAGADYRVAPGSVLGVAVAIGETNWGLSSGLGKGNSDVAQVGGYASTHWNNMYLSGAVAGAWYSAKTDRFVAIAGLDHLRGDFDAHSFSARAEAGWRWGTPLYGFTPYAAVQVQSVSTPAYGEVAVSGSNVFALNYAADTATDTRTELGGWIDTRRALDNGASVLLRGRAAWVHDFDPDRRIGALFQALPGASFTVDGARAAEDAALLSAAAELRLTNGVTLIGKFDGEFAGGSQTYAGTGTFRYAW